MFTGYNSDIEFDGMAFHIQTEDKGLDNPVVESRVYRGGEVVASVLTSYADLADSPDYTQGRIQRRMQEQHQSLIEDLQMGRLEAEPTVRRKARAGVIDADDLVEEYVEDWLATPSLTEPIHQALEQGIDAIQQKEAAGLPKKKENRTILALLVVLISVYAAFELGRVSQRSVEPRPEIAAPRIHDELSISVVGPVFDNPASAGLATDAAAPEPPESTIVEQSVRKEPDTITDSDLN